MTSDALFDVLSRVELLQGLSTDHLAVFDRRADRVTFKTGDHIISEGEPGDAAYLILSGEAVAIEKVGTPSPGEPIPLHALIGEMAMLIETSHGTTVVCRGPVQALKISRCMLHEQMAEDPSLADHFVEKITQRLHVMAARLRRADEAVAEAPRRFSRHPVILLPPPQSSASAGHEAHQ
jgi:CRP-like cAMP-binding protein